MLSVTARRLTYVVAALFAVVGAPLFVAPVWAAANFAYPVSPFLAMTMGGWYLGAAAYAFEAARVWRWSHAHGVLISTWAFPVLEGVLLIIHRDLLRLTGPLAIAYPLVLLVGSINAVVGIVDWLRTRPARTPEGPAQPLGTRVAAIGFVVYVSLLVLLLVDGVEPDGKFWPGPLSLLAARSFAAFFFSLVLGELVLVFARDLAAVETYMRAGFVAATIILVAAIVFIRQFDFVGRPGGLLYVGSYVLAVVGAVLVLAYGWARRRSEPAKPLAAPSG